MRTLYTLSLCGVWICLSGCTALKPPPAGEVLSLTEPDLGGEYHLYAPTNYRKSRSWPLLVLCHSSPWQSPRSVITDWAALAEDKGLLLLAPKLRSTGGWAPAQRDATGFAGDPAKLSRSQEQNEEAVLKALQHVKGGYSVARDKVFIAGRKSGCRAAMFIGLRNPDEFRLIALLQPRLDERHLSATEAFLDPYQGVLVMIAMGDLAKDQSQECLQWMRRHKMTVKEDRTVARSEKQPERVYRFIRNSVSRDPWIRVKAFETSSPMRVRFQAFTSFQEEIYKYEWDFGDGQSGVVARPEHDYLERGEYQVSVKIHPDNKTSFERMIRITVPAGYTTADSDNKAS